MKSFTHPLFGKCKVIKRLRGVGVLLLPITFAGHILLLYHADNVGGRGFLETRRKYLPKRLKSYSYA